MIYATGNVSVGAWGTDVRMTPNVVAVRQNLVPLVTGGRPTAPAVSADWQAWGSTCGASSCAASIPGIEHQWRSGIGVTANGALVYAVGPALDPLQLAQLLVRAGVIRGMQLDINPSWPVFASYDPATAGSRGAVQRQQAALLDQARPVDILRALVGTRLHHDVSPPGRMTALPPGLGLRPG